MYDDHHDFYSSNELVNHYHTSNVASGHHYNCAYGAGGDCTCGKIPFDAGYEFGEREQEHEAPKYETIFTIHVTASEGREMVCYYGYDLETAKQEARRVRDGGATWSRVRLQRRVFNLAGADYCIFMSEIREDMDRMADWASDVEHVY